MSAESERLSPRMKQWHRACRAKAFSDGGERKSLLRKETHRQTARQLAELGLVAIIVIVGAAVYLGCIWLACIHR